MDWFCAIKDGEQIILVLFLCCTGERKRTRGRLFSSTKSRVSMAEKSERSSAKGLAAHEYITEKREGEKRQIDFGDKVSINSPCVSNVKGKM